MLSINLMRFPKQIMVNRNLLYVLQTLENIDMYDGITDWEVG